MRANGSHCYMGCAYCSNAHSCIGSVSVRDKSIGVGTCVTLTGTRAHTHTRTRVHSHILRPFRVTSDDRAQVDPVRVCARAHTHTHTRTPTHARVHIRTHTHADEDMQSRPHSPTTRTRTHTRRPRHAIPPTLPHSHPPAPTPKTQRLRRLRSWTSERTTTSATAMLCTTKPCNVLWTNSANSSPRS